MVLFRDGYRRTRHFVEVTLGRLGVAHTLVEPASIEGAAAALRPETRLAVTEFPTNPYLRCLDLSAFRRRPGGPGEDAGRCHVRHARQRAAASHGVDVVVHSATKYPGGHNGVLGGTASGAAALVSLIREMRDVLGGVCDPHAAALIGRGMKTLALRVDRQNATGAGGRAGAGGGTRPIRAECIIRARVAPGPRDPRGARSGGAAGW